MAFPVPGASILLLNRQTGKQSRCSGKTTANEPGRGKLHPRKRRPQAGQTTKGSSGYVTRVSGGRPEASACPGASGTSTALTQSRQGCRLQALPLHPDSQTARSASRPSAAAFEDRPGQSHHCSAATWRKRAQAAPYKVPRGAVCQPAQAEGLAATRPEESGTKRSDLGRAAAQAVSHHGALA